MDSAWKGCGGLLQTGAGPVEGELHGGSSAHRPGGEGQWRAIQAERKTCTKSEMQHTHAHTHHIEFRELKIFPYGGSIRNKENETGGSGINLNGKGFIYSGRHEP